MASLPYSCVDGRRTVSIYVALDDVPEATAVRFLRGSHLDGLYFPRDFASGTSYVSVDPTMQPVPEVADDERILGADLEAGDTFVFDFRTLHGSGDAAISDRRRAFSTRWLGGPAPSSISATASSPSTRAAVAAP